MFGALNLSYAPRTLRGGGEKGMGDAPQLPGLCLRLLVAGGLGSVTVALPVVASSRRSLPATQAVNRAAAAMA